MVSGTVGFLLENRSLIALKDQATIYRRVEYCGL